MEQGHENPKLDDKEKDRYARHKKEEQKRNRQTVYEAVREISNSKYNSYLEKLNKRSRRIAKLIDKHGESPENIRAAYKTEEEVDSDKMTTITQKDVITFFHKKKRALERDLERTKFSPKGSSDEIEEDKRKKAELKKWSISDRTIKNALKGNITEDNLSRKNSKYYVPFQKQKSLAIQKQAQEFSHTLLVNLLGDHYSPSQNFRRLAAGIGSYFILVILEGIERAHRERDMKLRDEKRATSQSDMEWYIREWARGSQIPLVVLRLVYQEIAKKVEAGIAALPTTINYEKISIYEECLFGGYSNARAPMTALRRLEIRLRKQHRKQQAELRSLKST